MQFDVVTLFPGMFVGAVESGMIAGGRKTESG